MAQRKGFSLIEIMICLGVMIAFARLVLPSAAGYSSVGHDAAVKADIAKIAAGTFFAYNQVQESRKTATMHSDLNNITLAIQSYEALHRSSTLPGSLDDLVTGLAAGDSLDNTEHKFIQPSRFDSTASFPDPWGSLMNTTRQTGQLPARPKT